MEASSNFRPILSNLDTQSANSLSPGERRVRLTPVAWSGAGERGLPARGHVVQGIVLMGVEMKRNMLVVGVTIALAAAGVAGRR